MFQDWTRDERRAYTGVPPLGDDDPRGNEIGGTTSADGGLGSLSENPGNLAQAFLAVYANEGKQAADIEWAMFDVNTKAHERTWERAVALLLKDQERQIIALSRKFIREEKGLDADSTINFIEALAEWTTEKGNPQMAAGLYPLVISTGTAGVKRAAGQVGLNFAVLEQGLLDFATEEADFLASVMGETTGRKVANIVQKSLDAGGLPSDLRKDLQESAAFSRSRAKLVSRTETTRAWNGAQRRSLSDYERSQGDAVQVTKTWLTSRDDRVRPEHEFLDKETQRIDAVYSNGLQEPSEPNCRCTQTFALEAAPDAPAIEVIV